jgi:oligosaccharide repeat unit polymerase
MTDHPVLFWALLADVMIWIGIAHFIAIAKKDVLHIGVIFSGLFIVTYPLKFLASLFGLAVMNPLVLPDEWLWLSFFVFNLSGFMFLLPMLAMKPVFRFSNLPEKVNESVRSNFSWLMPVFAVLVIGISYGPQAITAVFSFSSDALQSRIEERGDERLGSGPLALFRTVGEVFLAFSLFKLAGAWNHRSGRARLKIFVFLAGSCLFLLAVSGSKHQGLLPLFYFVLFVNLRAVTFSKKPWLFSSILKGGLLGIFLVGLFGIIRGFGSIEDISGYGMWFQVLVQLSNAFDGPDNLAYILSRMNSLWSGDLSFEPTFQYLAGTVPRFLWPDKPVIMGNLFIQEIYLFERFSSETGEVISPSMPGEMLVSGGIIFMCACSFLLGLFFTIHYRLAHRSNSWVWKVLYAFLAANVFNVLRSGTGILGAYILFAGAVFIVWLILLFTRWLFQSYQDQIHLR